jgi:hypothetical protein
MDTTLAPIHVANHWPFVDRHLSLERWDTGRLALETVAQLQNDAGGEYVALGRSRLTASKLTPGQAGAIWRALVELEDRGVLARRRGAGRRPDAWGFRPELSQWRGMPWRYSGREVERVLCGCISRASCAVAARNPGQSVVFPRVRVEFRIAPQDHLLPPGALPVDTRGFRATRAANAHGRAWGPVDSRGYSAEIEPIDVPVLSTEELRTPLSRTQEEVVHVIKGAIEGRGDKIWGRYLDRLSQIVASLNVDQARLVAWKVSRIEPGTLVKVMLPQIADFTTHADVKAAGRSDGWVDDALAL